jgi:hypothetical protein
MKKSRFTDCQTMDALKRAEAGLGGAKPLLGAGYHHSDVLRVAFEVNDMNASHR